MILRSIAVPEEAVAADIVRVMDLGVNPLSAILIGIRPLNDTGTLANFNSYRNLCAAFNRVTVNWRGESIVNMRGEDIAALNLFRHGIQPYQGQHDDTDNERRCAVLPVLLGRHCFSKRSAFPASLRGELVLELDIDVADTGYDGFRFSVETIELPDAKPVEYERKVSIALTPAATGDNLIDMPPGHPCRGILLFGTTGFAGATPAPSWGRVSTLLDNREVGISASDFEMLQADYCLYGRQPPTYDAHRHRVTTDGNAQAELTTIGGAFDVGMGYDQYALIDFDPNADDEHTIDATGARRWALRANIETANALRLTPIDVVRVN